MSSKAYLFRMRHLDDIADVEALVATEDVWLSLIYKVRRKCLSFSKGDLVAALTTIDGDLDNYLAASRRSRYYQRLDVIPDADKEQPDETINGFRIKGWDVPRWSDSTWVRNSKAYISNLSD